MTVRGSLPFYGLVWFWMWAGITTAQAGGLPVRVPEWPAGGGAVRNRVTLDQVRNIVELDDGRLAVDLKEESLQGRIYTGPYPFEAGEADYDYMRFRRSGSIRKGVGILSLAPLFQDRYNANDWGDGVHTAAYRLHLWQVDAKGVVRELGFYDGLVSFVREKNRFRRTVTLIEGPLVGRVTSDDPTRVVVAWEADMPATGTVHLIPPAGGERVFTAKEKARRQEIRVEGLRPGTSYHYHLEIDAGGGRLFRSARYMLRTAPPKGGGGSFTFAFASDSREGVGGGERTYMGHNLKALRRIGQDAWRRGARFFLFGGDLVNGYTTETEDFRLQLKGWKQTLAGFSRSRAIYPIMGNHETLLRVFTDPKSRRPVYFDQWPYATDSAEAVFAQEFINPEDGPEPADPRRPTYKENVFSFQYGPVLCIGFNNNYWWTSNRLVARYGGSPEGYLMADQLQWIERRLAAAEEDRSVKYVLLYAQEPVFPCGGHVRDSMWWKGDNRLRACTWTAAGKLQPSPLGMIEVRNRFWRALAASTKVAAVLAGDEHAYHRLLVDRNTPVGVVARDDTDGDGVLDRVGPNPEFRHPVWQLTAGSAGAPYYNREKTPWEPVVYTSQAGYLLFEVTPERLGVTFYSLTGQAVDRVPDLLAVK